MLPDQPATSPIVVPRRHRPLRGALIRGLGVLLPPLLTIVILVWIWQTVKSYVLQPVTAEISSMITWSVQDIRTELPGAKPTDQEGVYLWHGVRYRELEDREFVPLDVYAVALRGLGSNPPPTTGWGVYRRYVETEYMRPIVVVPVFLVVFVALMYVLGSLVAAEVGQAVWHYFEHAITHLPVVRGVYGAAKQLTDYLLTEKPLEFSRVVAFEHPARGQWQIGFVASEGFAEIRQLAGEPVFAVLVHVNPIPVSGYIRLVPKSQMMDLDMTVDQAIHYIVSFGVVLPPQQIPQLTSNVPALPSAADSVPSPQR
ncbi:MAG TPA: DUF502 domain-containing protein [Pirellulales bacterium]|jgi:uncharacterized membrane protein|nr:DUF502 domain-containing protein [Pirellulales bacterium]